MKILLVQSYLGRREPPVFPLGLCYIATALIDHEVEIYDPNISQDPYGDLKNRIRMFQPDIIGISLRNIDTTDYSDIFYYYKTLEPTIDIVKDTKPEAKIMIGGAGFALYPRKIMERNPGIDYGIYLDGEESVVELMNNPEEAERVKGIYYRKNCDIYFTGHREILDLNSIPIPRRDFVNIKEYFPYPFNIGIVTKRGCSLKCAYCTYPHISGVTIRTRSPQNVVDEIEMLIGRYNIPNFMFVDSVFNIPLSHATGICEEILKRKIKIKWLAWYNEKNLNEEFMKLAIEAGCFGFSFSPDGFTDKTMKELGKNLSEKDVLKGYHLVKKIDGATAGYNFFINPPGQDIRGFIRLIIFCFKTRIFGRKKFHSFILGYPRIEPYTPLYKRAVEEGRITEDTDLLPYKKDDLYKVFYKNKFCWYINVIFKGLILLKKIKKTIIKTKKKSLPNPGPPVTLND